MKTLLKGFNQQRRAWFAAAVLLAVLCHPVSAQTTVVSNYATFRTALANSSVITNFMTNSTGLTAITLTTSGETIQINKNVTIDGGTNAVVFDAQGLTRIFTVATNCRLTLVNLQVINGTSTNGGGIYNSGTLIISNCIISGNAATNFSGAAGTTNSTGGNGGAGGNGGTADGGAIYSRGPVSIYNSVLGTNSALAGNGGSGGNGGNSLEFGGNGGNAGSGGSAFGAAVYSIGSSNIFVSTEFFNNNCAAGSAGSGGSGGSGAFPSNGGQGASGGSVAGGAVYVAGPVFVTNCVFAQNTITAGASGTDQSGNNNGFGGGVAEGGGVYIYGTVTNAYFENSVFFNNTCAGGAGGSATVGSVNGGNGGSALGGGLACAALRATVRNCTLATNTLTAGTYGTGTVNAGSIGSTGGWDICRTAGVLKLSGSILSGGTNVSPNPWPNALNVTDAGYNISSDASLVRAFTNTLINTNAQLDSGLAGLGGPTVGPANVAGPPFVTLDILDGSPATNFIPGVPGLSFPATDELGNPRRSPTSAGVYEFDPITIDTNPPPLDLSLEPTDQMTVKGGTVTFTAGATNFSDAYNNPVGYQWQLNGTNLLESATFHGATSPTLTVKAVTPALAGPYQVIVSPSLLEITTTSAPVSITIITPLKITAQPAGKPNVPEGSVVTFKVGAVGTAPLQFQWYMVSADLGTNMLADGNEISGSTTSNLTINPATTSDAGSYFVVVADAYHTNASGEAVLSVVPDTAKPTVAISSPAAGARTTNNAVAGTATDNAQVVQVNYWITNVNAWNSPAIRTNSGTAILGTNGTTTRTWSITNALLPGTNYVTAQSVDYSGNKSVFTPLTTRGFFYKSPAVLTLNTNGPGTFTGSASVAGDLRPAGGALLNIGEGYTLTAVPANKNYVLSNWVSSTGFTTNSPTLHFIMESGLAITANFTSNLFIGAAGPYNGLFYQATEVTEQTAGMLYNLKVLSTGSYSGSLLLGGGTYSLTGNFDTSGHATNILTRTTAKGGPVKVGMALDWAGGEITGSVSGTNPAAWTSSLEAEKAAAWTSAEYTVLLAPGSGSNAIGEMPPGFGYMLITNHNGSVTLSGALADGTTFSQGIPMGVSGDAPIYANLYTGGGLLLGWLGLSNGTVEAETPLAWIKPAAKSGLYAAGFTNLLAATGSGWTNPPAKTSAISLADGSLTITNASLDLDFEVSITNNTVVKASNATTNSLTGTIATKTGLLTITFGNGTGKATTIAYGAMLQDSTNGGGYFVTKTNAGAIFLTPAYFQ